ncbi:MAG: type I-C CRISPR-associated protein Cas8c/Csd1 [Chloroflexi bacterium]|nr:type I-C CRISPR-associated protein Cas8c/Csd1 [Chloroflexota bacterium]
MLLQRFKEYADQRLALPPTLYREAPVRYIVELDEHGRPLGRRPTDTSDPGNPRTKRGMRRHLPQVTRTMAPKPLLLADNSEYTFGLARETSKTQRVMECHRTYLDLLERCAAATHEPAVQAVATFLKNDPVPALDLPEDFDRGATITFRVHRQLEAIFPIDLPAVQSFWAAENDPAARSAPVMQCLVCGQERPVLARLQGNIKGVPGGQTSGTAIISANAEAFESYGLEASLIAPTCGECGERFTLAANSLLASEANRIVMGGAAFIFWTREPVDFSLRSLLTDPQPEQVRAVLESIRTGRPAASLERTAFYATVLSASGGRTVVRDWIDTTVDEVQRHLAGWFEAQRIVGAGGEEPRPLGLYALAAATVRELKDLAPPVPRALLRGALLGAPLPPALLHQVVRRSRAEQRVSRQHATLIKLCLLNARATTEEGFMVKLEPNHPSPAYHCGRLLAVLEEAQRLALPGVKATIVDRFFGTASSAPMSVFSRLVRGAQPHLAKLERDRPGAYYAIQRRMEEVMGQLGGFPRILTLQEQGLFALGYYHQRAYDRAQAREAAERRRAGGAATTDALPLIDENPIAEVN